MFPSEPWVYPTAVAATGATAGAVEATTSAATGDAPSADSRTCQWNYFHLMQSFTVENQRNEKESDYFNLVDQHLI